MSDRHHEQCLFPDGFASHPCFGQSRPMYVVSLRIQYASTDLVSQASHSSTSLPPTPLNVHVYDVFAPSQYLYQCFCIRCGSAVHRTTLPSLPFPKACTRTHHLCSERSSDIALPPYSLRYFSLRSCTFTFTGRPFRRVRFSFAVHHFSHRML